jgi:hypothetical protein
MTYEIICNPDVLSGVFEFFQQPSVLECFESHMQKLAGNPATLSKPSYVPHPEGQQYTFSCKGGPGRAIGFSVYFKYHANEAELLVFEVTAEPYWHL